MALVQFINYPAAQISLRTHRYYVPEALLNYLLGSLSELHC